jgi:hypothetical protein
VVRVVEPVEPPIGPFLSRAGGLLLGVLAGFVCAFLGGLSGDGVGVALDEMPAHPGPAFLGALSVLGWLTAAGISVTTAAVWLRTDLTTAARRLWWIYVAACLVGLYGVRIALVQGPTGKPQLAGWGWLSLLLFSGAWPSVVFCGVAVVWARFGRRRTLPPPVLDGGRSG